MFNRSPILQLIRCNVRAYIREPEAIFWTYGFPLLMVIGLGIAFDASRDQQTLVDIVAGPGAGEVIAALEGAGSFRVRESSWDEAFLRLRRNRTHVVVTIGEDGAHAFHFDPSNPEGRSARAALNGALQRAAGRSDPLPVEDREVTTPGSRYVDFLVPGLIGMNLMGGGMWGVGFVLVDMRIKKLLKRMLGTPMRRSQFLLSTVGTRALFFIPEVFVLLLAAHWIFGVPIEGSIPGIILLAFVGAMAFAGLGLLAASRAQRIETVSGIMNVVMLPMWLCSGVFFSAERFPAVMQPFIQALPLTQLINALRAVILEGVSLSTQALPLAVLTAWAVVAFLLALKWFRWS
jgi:ABC-2 type transport system permease protein